MTSYFHHKKIRHFLGGHQDGEPRLVNVDLAARDAVNINQREKLAMTNFKTFTIVTAAIIAIANTASAKEATFQAVITLDRTVSIEAQYTSIQEQVKNACRSEVRKAGFRATESTSWLQSKCERQLIERSIKSIKSNALIAFHNRSTRPSTPIREYANK